MSEERIAKLEAQIDALKEVITAVGNSAQKATNDVAAELGRINRVNLDRSSKVEGIASANSDKVAALEKLILGDGEQDPGIRAQLREVQIDTSDLKLDKRDRETRTKTRTGLLTAVWTFGGAIIVGLLFSTLKGLVDEKAQSALRVQAGNEQEFAAIKAKADKNNEIFYNSISALNIFRGKAESDLEWLKKK